MRPTNYVVPSTTIYDETVYDEGDPGEITLSGPACGPPAGCLRLWGSLEYLLWWESGSKYPPLATTSPIGTSRNDAGVLGLDSTSILLGGDGALNNGSLSGGRVTLGMWLDSYQRMSFVARGFGIEDHGRSFAATTNGSDILARPFFNAFTGQNDALLLGFPNQIRGDMQIVQDAKTRGAQAMLRHLYRAGCNYRIDFVLGYRYLGVDESMQITNSLEFIDPTLNTFGTTVDQFDSFEIENEFHGGELGFMGHSEDGRWTLDFLATIALGSMRQRATVSGSSVATSPGSDPVNLTGGLLTQGTNIGTFDDDPFTVVPELTVTLGYFVTPKLDLSFGYTFLYASRISRPGQVIDSAVNLTQQTGNLAGPARPEFQFSDSDYWLQGLNIGLNLRY